MTRAETLAIRSLERGSYLLGPWMVSRGLAEDGETVQLETTHTHFEAASWTPQAVTVGLVPVAGGRAWYGVCTCGTAFIYDPSQAGGHGPGAPGAGLSARDLLQPGGGAN